ncbi:MAG: hypothetical protein LBK47_06910 [Prevotellaceae bacterium]|jgi:hypothetical protein|nr:hypothetical protein [Prevotellaceae bacterium]
MKINILNMTTMLLVLAGSFLSCKEDEKKCSCSNEQAFEVVDLKGVVNFNEKVQQWYISVHEAGTYDEARLFFPCSLEEAYKVPNKNVLFSGAASNLSLDISNPTGAHCFCIEISFISCENSEPTCLDSSTLIGKWEWTKTYRMIPLDDMNPLTPENTGTTESIIFTADSAWRKIKNQEVAEYGERFTVGHGFYASGDGEYDSILYIKNEIPIGADYFKIEGNNLIFSSDYAGTVGSGSKWFERSK